MVSPKRAFQQQRANAADRGIDWELTYDEWWSIWEPYYHLRGRGKNALCMARERDTGPYAVGNVYLTTNLGNMADKRLSVKAEDRQKEKRQKEIDRGGAPAGYGWKHPCGSGKRVESKSESIKQTGKRAEYDACNIDQGDIFCAAERQRCL